MRLFSAISATVFVCVLQCRCGADTWNSACKLSSILTWSSLAKYLSIMRASEDRKNIWGSLSASWNTAIYISLYLFSSLTTNLRNWQRCIGSGELISNNMSTAVRLYTDEKQSFAIKFAANDYEWLHFFTISLLSPLSLLLFLNWRKIGKYLWNSLCVYHSLGDIFPVVWRRIHAS